MNTLTGEILTLPKMSGSVSTPKSLSGNVGAKTINIGGKGDDGATFIPSVSADGIISWTNDKDLPNPEPVNIKGTKGDRGDKGDKGDTGATGAQGEPGKDGADGKDGTSATHSWNGTVLTITSASGTYSADLKGDPGEPGVDGADYILTDADKTEIAEMAAELVEVPDSGGNVAYDEEQKLTEEQKAQARANIGAQPVGEYLTEVPEGYAKNEDIKKVDRKVDTLREVVSKFHNNIVCDSKGEVITVSDASDMELAGLHIFGKTTQNGTPTPEAPVPLVNVGNGGSITVKVGTSETDENPQTLTISTPNGLPGIPVASGGNYTDASGQQWICDEVDFARGKYVQRVGVKVYTGNESWRKTGITEVNSYAADNSIQPNAKQPTLPMSTHFVGTTNNSIVGVFLSNEHSAVFGVDKSTLPTLADWIAWLKSQSANGTPLTVLYLLKTPIETDLTAEELAAYAVLHTNYPQTTIYNDEGAWMAVKYVADTKLYIDKKFAELSAALLNQ